jgi:hypothetical protein
LTLIGFKRLFSKIRPELLKDLPAHCAVRAIPEKEKDDPEQDAPGDILASKVPEIVLQRRINHGMRYEATGSFFWLRFEEDQAANFKAPTVA